MTSHGSSATSRRRLTVLGLFVGLLAAQTGPLAQQACAQGFILQPNGRAVGTGNGPEDGGAGQRLFITDRRLTQRLKKSRELIAEGKTPQALPLLQSLLDHEEDFFIPPESGPKENVHSLKRDAERILGELPREGRKAYELQYGTTARQMLTGALESGDLAEVEEVARRFFHTEAGYEATYWLGTHHLDHNRSLAAALQFERLRELPEARRHREPMLSLKTALCWQAAGMPKRSRQTLFELKARTDRKQVTLGGRDIAFFEENDQAGDWLRTVFGRREDSAEVSSTWSLFRGDPSRNVSATEALPVWDADWAVATTHPFHRDDGAVFRQSETVEATLNEIEARYRDGDYLTLPAAQPLVIDDVVVFRTLRHLKAVDRRIGRPLWVVEPFYQVSLGEESRVSVTLGSNQFSLLDLFLSQRAWRDMTAGTLSSDGRYVFALEQLGFLHPLGNDPRQGARPEVVADSNRLVGYELATGRARLELGGTGGNQALGLDGAFFLGPPLPLGDRLYCLAERQGELRLLAIQIDSSNPVRPQARLVWSQSLLVPELTIDHAPLRRLSGISPSYADGIMVCPTTGGAVVGVDVTRQRLLWGYRYPTNTPDEALHGGAQIAIRGANLFGLTGEDDESRWLDSVPIIADGRVLLTPRDSDELHCLSLIDGSLQWKKRRGEALYVAGVYDAQVIVVSRTQVHAYGLEDGHPVWPEPTPIPMPSGRGFRNGPLYRLPLSTGEIATLDLRTGQIVARSSMRSGRVPGNLVAAGGSIVSQSIRDVVGFRPVEQLRKETQQALAANPDDPEALALRGEMRLHQGQEEAGLKDLLRSIKLQAEPRAEELVIGTLLDGLRLDFEKYRQRIPEIERLLRTPRHRMVFLRRFAAGLQEQGQSQAAFDQYLKLATIDREVPRLERVSGSLLVRSDQWIGPRLAELYHNATPAQRERMDSAIREVLQTAREADDPQPLRRFLSTFSRLPVVDEARRALIQRLDADRNALEMELQLLQLRRSGDRSLAGFATARLTSLWIKRDRARDVRALLEALETTYAEVTCLDGKTGRELADAWRGEERIAQALPDSSSWPARPIRADQQRRRGGIQMVYPVEIVGPRAPFAEHWSLELDPQRRHLVARDGAGQKLWQVPVTNSRSAVRSLSGNHARMAGHLLIVVLDSRIMAMSLLADGARPEILWRKNLYQSELEWMAHFGMQVQRLVVRGGRGRIVRSGSSNGMNNAVGPVTETAIYYLLGTRLYAADVLTGEVLWERRGIARDSDLFGDEEFVVVAPADSSEGVVFQASDGQQVTTTHLPDTDSWLDTTGRFVLWRKSRGENDVLVLTDPVSGRARWQHTIPDNAVLELIKGDEAAVLAPNGRFTVLKLDDGTIRFQGDVQPQADLGQIVVRRSRDRYVLLTYSSEPNQNNVQTVALGYDSALVNGFAYGFDRAAGTLLWSRRVEQQSINLNQPDNLPVLVFAVRVRQRFQRRRPRSPNEFALLILDARTGETVHQHAGEESLYPFEIEVDPDEPRVNVNFYQRRITLRPVPEPQQAPKPNQ